MPLAGQTAPRLWAAQTGPDQVSLSWDSVPGTHEYLVYAAPADSVIGNLRMRPPLQRLSGSSHSSTVFGVRRLSSGITLVAMAANGHVIQKAEFNRVAPATTFQVIQPPEEVTAEVTGPTEITLSWTPVPGATAYYVGRAVAPGGYGPLCPVCSAEPRYVDRDVVPGADHGYVVAAIFPNGKSQPAPSNKVTPGAPQLATATASTADKLTPPATTSTTNTAPSTSTTATVPLGSNIYGGVVGGLTAPAQSGTSQTAPIQDAVTGVVGATSGVISTVLGNGVATPAGFTAAIAGPGAVRLTWQPSATAGVTAYRLSRRVNGGAWEVLNTIAPSTLAYSDVFFPVTLFPTGTARVSYTLVAIQSTVFSQPATTGELTVQPPPAPAPATATTAAACKLDYQRADNMWAAFGRPDGPLGTETISLTPGQDKVFITDWKYEKTRNDGSNYYGSHLRIATNASSRTIRLQLRTTDLSGLLVFLRTGSDTFWIRLDPGKVQQFRADLMEVFCEN